MHLKKQAFGFRLDAVPKLKSNTINFILQAVKSDGNIGFDSQRKDFQRLFLREKQLKKFDYKNSDTYFSAVTGKQIKWKTKEMPFDFCRQFFCKYKITPNEKYLILCTMCNHTMLQ